MSWSVTARTVALVMALAPSLAFAHGGGGGGGHGGGGHYVYVPIYGGAMPVVVPPAKVGDTSKIKTVAIISAIATKLTIGSKALFGTHKDIDISDWKLDNIVETTMKTYLSKAFVVKDVPYDRATLGAIPNDHFDTDSAKPVHDFLAALPSEGIDAFIVIRPDSEGMAAPTAGLSFDASNGYYLRPVEIANFEIDIVDAHTGAVISHALSRIANRQQTPADFAAIYAPAGLALTPKDTPTDYQRAQLKNDYARLLALSLRETLRSLNLPIALPDVGARNLVPIPLDKAPLRKIHTLAVVSAIGDRVSMDHRGAFFAHKEGTASTPDWNIDSAVEAKLTASLDKRFAVKPPTGADRAKLASLDLFFDAKTLTSPIDGLSAAPDIDAYVVVLKHKVTAPGISDAIGGLGLWNFSNLAGENTMAFVNYAVLIVDAHTLKPIWVQRGTTSPLFPSDTPVHVAGNANWPKDAGPLSPDQANALRQMYLDMLNDSVPETAFRMSLSGMMVAPPPGVTDLPQKPGVTTIATVAPDATEAAAPAPGAASPPSQGTQAPATK